MGAVCWALTVAYLLVHLWWPRPRYHRDAWPTPYDLSSNSISDFGVTACGGLRQFGDRVVYVCSPLHALMKRCWLWSVS